MVRIYPKPIVISQVIPYRAAQIIANGLVSDGFEMDKQVNDDVCSLWFWDSDISMALSDDGRYNTKKLDAIGLRELSEHAWEAKIRYRERQTWCKDRLARNGLVGQFL